MRKTGAKVSLCPKKLHRMTPENTYEHPSKGAECRECKRDYMREYMREARARAARAARRGSSSRARAR